MKNTSPISLRVGEYGVTLNFKLRGYYGRNLRVYVEKPSGKVEFWNEVNLLDDGIWSVVVPNSLDEEGNYTLCLCNEEVREEIYILQVLPNPYGEIVFDNKVEKLNYDFIKELKKL